MTLTKKLWDTWVTHDLSSLIRPYFRFMEDVQTVFVAFYDGIPICFSPSKEAIEREIDYILAARKGERFTLHELKLWQPSYSRPKQCGFFVTIKPDLRATRNIRMHVTWFSIFIHFSDQVKVAIESKLCQHSVYITDDSLAQKRHWNVWSFGADIVLLEELTKILYALYKEVLPFVVAFWQEPFLTKEGWEDLSSAKVLFSSRVTAGGVLCWERECIDDPLVLVLEGKQIVAWEERLTQKGRAEDVNVTRIEWSCFSDTQESCLVVRGFWEGERIEKTSPYQIKRMNQACQIAQANVKQFLELLC